MQHLKPAVNRQPGNRGERLVEHYGCSKPILQSQDAAERRNNFSGFFRRHGLFVTGIVPARSGRDASLQVHDIPCHVMDCYKEREPSEAAKHPARDGENEICAGSNRSNRQACAEFVNFVDSNFSPRNHISKSQNSIRSKIICTLIRLKSHIITIYSAKFIQ